MSSTTIVCILLIVLISNINFIRLTSAVSQCDLSSAIHLQSATFSHSLILRVQPILSSEQDFRKMNRLMRKILVREIIKIPTINRLQNPVKMNDIVIIRINDEDERFLDDSCWHLLRISTVDVILFLNETSANEFNLYYPPVESTIRVRQNIDAVLNHETYPPQVIIKTRQDKAILSKDYSLQCNSRGNPLPRLSWSKKLNRNETLEYYPFNKQCKTSCQIYSIQNKYQSILYFQSLTLNDIGLYVCHAENAMNRTATSIYLNINDSNRNLTCSSLRYCHYRGQCVNIDKQLKCLCDNRYFGDHCETNYDEIIKKQDSAILLFKSRFLAGCILVLVGFLLLLIALLSWFLGRKNKQQRNKLKTKLPTKTSVEKPLLRPVEEKIPPSQEIIGIIPSPILNVTKPSTTPTPPPPPPPPPPATSHIIHSPIIEKKVLTPPIIRRGNHQATLTRESSTATEEDDEDGLNSFLRHYQTLPPVPTKIDEEYEERFSLKMNKSEELGLGCLTNGINNNDLILSRGYTDFYQPGNQTGLIKPLNILTDVPQRYTKYVSSYSRFVLPRPVKQASEYQQR